MLLFIVMINDLGFENQLNNAGELATSKRNMKLANEIHLKYVDDFTLAEAINLPKQLIEVPDSDRQQPDSYHARTGHVLPLNNSKVYKQLKLTEAYAKKNEMKINHKKTKLIVFNQFKFWFKTNRKNVNTRQTISKYCNVKANYVRYEKSPLGYLTKLLNMHYHKK